MSRKAKEYRPKKSGAKEFDNGKQKFNRGKLYDKDWNTFRFRFLHHNPKCYVCAEKATVVDHIEAHKGDENIFKRWGNHCPLCKRCHDTITGKFDQYNPPKTKEKVQWIHNKRLQFDVKVRIKPIEYYKRKLRGEK